ncbi:MAG TPA: trypsin-like peptidase domain-containing protein [Paenibacillus sp.]|uniref:S1C family serine protease n=1 Tax=Paenibacillus sp. TaxID=58172 RepID=UPI002BB14F82|nr:trypsin-like peptidase domain-containing protein [Paenibacillus sp.]HUC93629.1 trypsin-like peptidase domain-containing protein [Paenibacillus sp.]
MGLFDDDFYSTRVSRKARAGKDDRGFSSFGKTRNWGPVQIAFASSFVSALGAVLLFGLIFGFGGVGDGTAGGRTTANPVQTGDTAERIIQASAKVRPAVVSIINEQMLPDGGDSGVGTDDRQGEPNAGGDAEPTLPEDEGTLQQAGLGSGVIFRKSGGKALIITNNHVVEGAYSVKAVLGNGELREAKVIGKDQITDLAVLEIDGRGIDTVVEIGDSDKLRDGETVIAIGNPLGLGDSLTMGIVSKRQRVIPVSLNQDGVYDWEQEVIQIDASINQGNSGGALVNLNGELVGINSMKVADYGVEGLGFAIPIDNAMPVVETLMKYGKVSRPYLGVYTMDLEQYFAQQPSGADEGSDGSGSGSGDGERSGAGADEPESGGADDAVDNGAGGADTDSPLDEAVEGEDLKLPKDVTEGVIVLEAVGPAQEAGLTFNDVIVKLDDQPVGSTMELRKYLYEAKKIGDKIEVSFYRDGKLEKVSFKLAEKTDEE